MSQPRPIYVNGLRIGGVTKGENNTFETLRTLWYPDKTDLTAALEVSAAIASFEREHKIQLPADLKTIAAWPDVDAKVCHAFPTNNDFLSPDQWELIPTGDRYALKFMDENQGCCYWYVVWDGKAAENAQVWVGGPNFEDTWLTADRLVDFFVDYTQEGTQWYQQHMPSKPPSRVTIKRPDGTNITILGLQDGDTYDENGNIWLQVD